MPVEDHLRAEPIAHAVEARHRGQSAQRGLRACVAELRADVRFKRSAPGCQLHSFHSSFHQAHHTTAGRSRTHTEPVLSRPPLPIGLPLRNCCRDPRRTNWGSAGRSGTPRACLDRQKSATFYGEGRVSERMARAGCASARRAARTVRHAHATQAGMSAAISSRSSRRG